MSNNELPPEVPTNLQDAWNDLQRERDRLRSEVDQLRAERQQWSKALVDLLGQDVNMSDKEILAQFGRDKPIRDLLKELRQDLVRANP